MYGRAYTHTGVRSLTASLLGADALVQIVHDEGLGALWNGTFPSLLLVLNPAIQFMIYEGLKRQLRRGGPREVILFT